MKKLTCPNPLTINHYSSVINHHSSRKSKGFTLIELLVVIAILAILAVVVAIAINPAQKIKLSKDAKLRSDLGQMSGALQAYYTGSTGTSAPYYPSALDGLTTNQQLSALPNDPDSVAFGATGYKYTLKTFGTNIAYPQQAILYSQTYSDSNKYICWDSKSAAFESNDSSQVPTCTAANACSCPN